MVAEVNASRRESGYPQMEYYYVVQDLNEYPYEIWNVTTTFQTGEIHFKQIGEVMNDEQYKKFFDTSK